MGLTGQLLYVPSLSSVLLLDPSYPGMRGSGIVRDIGLKF